MYINYKFSSPNHSPRIKNIEYVILHYTQMMFDDALSKLTDSESLVSCHYLIKANGDIFSLVEDDKIAWHAGLSAWKNSTKLNENSIGIELDNLGNTNFSKEQLNACAELCIYLKNKYNIDASNFIGHSDVAPSRKIDPGIFFDWELLSTNNIGIWHDIKYSQEVASRILFHFGQEDKKIFELQTKLAQMGYQMIKSGILDIETSNVIRAFQAHFIPEIIHKKGGIDFYCKLSSSYNWDQLSDIILQKLLTQTS